MCVLDMCCSFVILIEVLVVNGFVCMLSWCEVCVWIVFGGGRVLDEWLDFLIMFFEWDKFYFLWECVENMWKYFYNEMLKFDFFYYGIFVFFIFLVFGVIRVCLFDYSLSNFRNDVGFKFMFGYFCFFLG